jgi:hypothetical protein
VVTTRPRRWPGRLTQIVAGLAVTALVVAGVVAVGNAARNALGPHDRYLLPFADVEAPAPPGMDRAEFLDEVRYLGPYPEKLNVLDPGLPELVREAFSRHRRVARVDKVQILPPKRVRVELTFRP